GQTGGGGGGGAVSAKEGLSREVVNVGSVIRNVFNRAEDRKVEYGRAFFVVVAVVTVDLAAGNRGSGLITL
ncbi:hypothetical protein Tco_0361141, partial [Tanacetum coccineum]